MTSHYSDVTPVIVCTCCTLHATAYSSNESPEPSDYEVKWFRKVTSGTNFCNPTFSSYLLKSVHTCRFNMKNIRLVIKCLGLVMAVTDAEFIMHRPMLSYSRQVIGCINSHNLCTAVMTHTHTHTHTQNTHTQTYTHIMNPQSSVGIATCNELDS